MQKSPAILMGTLLALSLGASAQARQEQMADAGKPKASATSNTPAPAAAAVSDPDYKIGPQDVLRIDVWKENEISRITRFLAGRCGEA